MKAIFALINEAGLTDKVKAYGKIDYITLLNFGEKKE